MRCPFHLLVLLVALTLVLASSGTSTGATKPPPKAAPIVVRVDDGGFGWADAAIGLLAGVGLALAVVGGVALARPDVSKRAREPKGEHS